MADNKQTFNYTYSSINKAEIEKIRSKYIQNQESDLDELRKIDAKVTNTSAYVAIFVGIVGVLTFGTGLSLVLSFNKLILEILCFDALCQIIQIHPSVHLFFQFGFRCSFLNRKLDQLTGIRRI